ncbi:acylphosphatase [Thermophilibacter sp.]
MSFFGRRGDTGITAPDDAVRLHLRFVGEVQGVGFRWTSSMVARELELTGWVINNPDGSVTAEIQGAPAHVGAFIPQMLEAYRHRPIRYVVKEREEIPVDRSEHHFEVRY